MFAPGTSPALHKWCVGSVGILRQVWELLSSLQWQQPLSYNHRSMIPFLQMEWALCGVVKRGTPLLAPATVPACGLQTSLHAVLQRAAQPTSQQLCSYRC